MKKILVLLITLTIILGSIPVSAKEIIVDTPKITVKYINNKTGVKIIIDKTIGADVYNVYIKGYGNSYTNYLADYMKHDLWRRFCQIRLDGSEKRICTINGLPKGTYSVKVVAINEEVYASGKECPESNIKTVKIKGVKTEIVKENTYDFSKVKVGDTITFGSYEQDDIMTNGKEDIEWIVMSKTKSQLLVVSKYALDCLPYNTEGTFVTWENCTLRKWLNNIFYKTAFTTTEQNMIKKTKLKNPDNPYYGTDSGNSTKDKIFLLSIDDITNTKYGFNADYFAKDINRQCAPTEYAIAHGLGTEPGMDFEEVKTSEGKVACSWWLRTSGYDQGYAVYVSGHIGIASDSFNTDYEIAVRPAMWISLKSE